MCPFYIWFSGSSHICSQTPEIRTLFLLDRSNTHTITNVGMRELDRAYIKFCDARSSVWGGRGESPRPVAPNGRWFKRGGMPRNVQWNKDESMALSFNETVWMPPKQRSSFTSNNAPVIPFRLKKRGGVLPGFVPGYTCVRKCLKDQWHEWTTCLLQFISQGSFSKQCTLEWRSTNRSTSGTNVLIVLLT